MSAVSMNVTPRSRARWMVAIDSSQSVAPYHSLIPMQPRPWADTVNWPSVVVRMSLVLLLESLLSASVLDCVGARREGPADLLAVLFQQLDAFGLTRARPDQLGVPLHVPDRHPGRAQLGQQGQPLQVALAEAAAAVPAALDLREQADPLVPAQRVLGKTALGGGLADAPGRHE